MKRKSARGRVWWAVGGMTRNYGRSARNYYARGALCTKPLAQKLASTSQRSGSGGRGVSTSAIIGSSLVSRVVRRNQVNGKAGSDMDSHESGSDGSTDATLIWRSRDDSRELVLGSQPWTLV